MSAHTLGPWFVDRNHAGNIMGVASPKRRHDLEFVAECQDEANARLIAAAPDLLEALRKAERHCPPNSEAEILARAAIAKAEGNT